MNAQIHIFSGLGSSIIPSFKKDTKNIERLIDLLPSKADAKHHIWNDWRAVAKEIVRRHSEGNHRPIILIGHSNGVLACAEVAQVLYKRGIKVSYMAAIDPTLKSFPEIRNNTLVVDEFRASRGLVAIGRWFSRGKKGIVKLTKRYNGKHNMRKHRAGHIGIVGLPSVQNRILIMVRALLKK